MTTKPSTKNATPTGILLNADGEPYRAQKQRALLANWLPHLEAIPEIDLIWIEGSMAAIGEWENPGSDIDIRFGIKDDAFETLWNANRPRFFQPLGDVLQLAPFRIVSQEGVLIEFEAFPTSECIGKAVVQREFLLNRLPDGQPDFALIPPIAKDYWPHKHEINLQNVGNFTINVLRRMSIAAAPFYLEKPHSASCSLHLMRTKLLHVLYWRAGIQPFLRAKRLEQIFSKEFFDDYAQGEFLPGENAMDITAIGAATLRIYQLLLKHCEALFADIQQQAHYPKQWATLIYDKMHDEIQQALVPDENVRAQPATDAQPYRAQKQRALLAKWLPHLEAIPEIDLVWVEGSVAAIGEWESPVSDIDIRFAIRDDAFDSLWNANRPRIFQPLGEVLQLAAFRLVSQEGILIEFEAYPTSECLGKAVFTHEFLLNRLPADQPGFASVSGIPTEYWPHQKAVNLQSVGRFTISVLRRMSIASTPFFLKPPHSASCSLQLLRTTLLQMLYWRAGIQPFMRAKRLEEIFPQEFFDDYAQSEFLAGENAMDKAAIGAATLRIFAMLLKHCEALFHEIQRQQDYPKQWATLIYNKLSDEISDALAARQPN